MISLVTLSGLDGSGKSTQVKYVKESLEKSGGKVYYFHATNFSLPQRIKSFMRGKSKGKEIGASKTQTNKFGLLLRILILPIDLLRFEFLRLKLFAQGYSVIASDRYFYDTLVNIAFLSKTSFILPIPVRKPHAGFYLKATPQKILKRDRKPDQGIDYLLSKEKLYDHMAQNKRLIIVDGNRPVEKVATDISNYLQKRGF